VGVIFLISLSHSAFSNHFHFSLSLISFATSCAISIIVQNATTDIDLDPEKRYCAQGLAVEESLYGNSLIKRRTFITERSRSIYSRSYSSILPYTIRQSFDCVTGCFLCVGKFVTISKAQYYIT